MVDMKILKNIKLWIAVAAVLVVTLITVVTLVVVNKYYIDMSVQDGDTIYIEYGHEDEHKVTAVYKGTIFEQKGVNVPVELEGNVDYTKVGTYHVTYTSTHKKVTKTINVTLVIEDTTAPVIELTSAPNHFTSPVGVYEEEGYKAIDNYDGDITDAVTRVDEGDVVKYTVTDKAGNTTTVERIIVYKDVIPPVITLNGTADVTIAIGKEYVDAGYSATDECDGDITSSVVVSGTVDINNYGTYPLTYKVVDKAGNVCEVVRNVKVADIIKPTISLKGGTQFVKLGESYVDGGYSASDNIDGNITDKVSISGSVDTSKEGTYVLTYKVQDTSGNVATVTRKVYVYEKQMQVTPVNPGNKVVYLTFDDGPGPYTARLLDILDKYGVKATFFVTGQKPAYYNMIGETYRRGHTVALHTYTHNYNIYKSEETYYADLQKISDLVYSQTGIRSNIVRFPGGTSNTISRNYCKGIMSALSKSMAYHGFLYCDWNVSSGDAGSAKTAAQVAANVINGMKRNNVSIVLQHDIKNYSVTAVEEILAWGLANGYTFLPMDETTPMSHHGVNN